MCTPFSPPFLYPPSLPPSLPRQQPVVHSSSLCTSLSPFLSFNSPHTRADAGAVSIHTCTCVIFLGYQDSWRTPSTRVCTGCCELIHARMCAWAFLYFGACALTERHSKDAWWALSVVIWGVCGVQYLCCPSYPPSSLAVWQGLTTASRWDVHLTWCKRWKPKELL